MSELKVNRITDTSGNEVLKSDSGTWTVSASFTQNFTDSILTNPTLSGTMTGGTISSETTGTHSGPSTGLHSGQVTGSITGSIASSADFQSANIKPAFSALDNYASNGPTSGMAVTKSDSLPLFGCRAWVNFDGSDYVTVGAENHCAIRASGNIEKVVRTANGRYTIHFATDMPDTNYCVNGNAYGWNGSRSKSRVVSFHSTSSSEYNDSNEVGHFRIIVAQQLDSSTVLNDVETICVTVFR